MLHVALPAAAQDRTPRKADERIAAVRPPPGGAEAPCPSALPARPLALREVLELAWCASPRRMGALALVRSQRAQVDIERSAGGLQAEAEVGIGAGVERNALDGSSERGSRGTRSWAWALRWELFDFGRRQAQTQGAWHLVRAALDSGDGVVQEVLLGAGTAYFQLVRAEGVAQTLHRSRAATRHLLREALRLRGKNTLDRLGELQARTQIARVQLELSRAEAEVELARAELARQLGHPPGTPVQVQAPAEAPQPPAQVLEGEIETLIADAVRQHPEVLAARSRVQSQAALVEASRRADRPTLALKLEQGRQRDPFGLRRQGDSVGLAVTVPLIDSGQRSAQVAQATAELDGRQADLQALERQAGLAVWTAHHALRTHARTIELGEQMMSIARELLDAETAAFLGGESDMFDVLDAQASVNDASIEVLTARANLEVARLQLAAALGRLR